MRLMQHRQVDTVIVGSGPAALILSYILHGNIPVYDLESPHPDPILHSKLKDSHDLLTVDVDHLTEHFPGSRFSYSTQALPVNVLFDTLNRPLGETGEGERKTCIKWVHDSKRAIPHVVVGNTREAGGQWADNPVKASWDIGTLSYAGMLSLPGYSFDDYYLDFHGTAAPDYLRPTRRDVARYYAEYPHKVGIADAIYGHETLSGISRSSHGFWIASHQLTCKRLVLASGIFTNLVAPRPLLQPLTKLGTGEGSEGPILIVGSGFTAADVILSTPREQKIIHIYKWAPTTAPSPLRACHQQAYPEYAGVYRKMRLAALAFKARETRRPSAHRRPSQLDMSRDWDSTYEGMPNTAIIDVQYHGHDAVVTLQTGDGLPFTRTVRGFAYLVGRRGSLEYLDLDLRTEVCPDPAWWKATSGSSMRERLFEDLEVAPDVFVIGSLTGDSLIRFSYGGCAYAAGRLMASHSMADTVTQKQTVQAFSTWSTAPVMRGLQGHATAFPPAGGMPLDRRKSEICVEGA